MDERLHGVGAQVIMEFVHMHEGLPAVAGIIESRPSYVAGWIVDYGRLGVQGSTHRIELQPTD